VENKQAESLLGTRTPRELAGGKTDERAREVLAQAHGVCGGKGLRRLHWTSARSGDAVAKEVCLLLRSRRRRDESCVSRVDEFEVVRRYY